MGGKRTSIYVPSLSETKTVAQWGRDDRTEANALLISQRLARGWDAERAVMDPAGSMGVYITALGKTKTVSQWGRDDLVEATGNIIFGRLNKGWDAVDAVVLPIGSANPSVRRKAEANEAQGTQAKQRRRAIAKERTAATRYALTERALEAMAVSDGNENDTRERLSGLSKQRLEQLSRPVRYHCSPTEALERAENDLRTVAAMIRAGDATRAEVFRKLARLRHDIWGIETAYGN